MIGTHVGIRGNLLHGAEVQEGCVMIPWTPHIKCDLHMVFLRSIFIHSTLALFLLMYVFIYIAPLSKNNVTWLMYSYK